MAKTGMDSFLLDCRTDDSMAELEAMYGIKGFAIIIRLLQKIYSENGYYCEWTERSPVLFLATWFGGGSGVDVNIIREVVNAAVKLGIFSTEMYDKYKILTSEEIQSKYFEVAKRRTQIEVENAYLLLSAVKSWENVKIVSEILADKKMKNVNVNRNAKNVDISIKKADIFSTSKVKESKCKDINIMCKKQSEANDNMTKVKAEASVLFEDLWKQYPQKRGKAQVSDSCKLRIYKVGREEMQRAIARYLEDLERDKDWRKPQNGSTFFNGGYIDYLDDNYVKPAAQPKKPAQGNRFNNFHQRDTDYDALESELISNKL